MKPVLNFQIPYPIKKSSSEIEFTKHVLEKLKDRLSDDYEVIITPWQLQAGNMVNITITSETDIEELFRKICNAETKSDYDFHSRYMPANKYLILDYDGDENVNPLDALNAYWKPIITMINYTRVSDHDLLQVCKHRNVNPFTISRAEQILDNDPHTINLEPNGLGCSERNNVVDFDDYIIWMIGQINQTSKPASEIYERIKEEGVDPMLIVEIEDVDDTPKFIVLDKTPGKCSTTDEMYREAAICRRFKRDYIRTESVYHDKWQCKRSMD